MSMSQFETFTIGFGNSQGQTNLVLLQQKRSKIQIVNLRATKLEHPKIEIRKFNQISLGQLEDCIRKKRDKQVLSDLLRFELNCDVNKIAQNCSALQKKVNNDIVLLETLVQQRNTNKFMQKTKSSRKQAQKYLTKYKNLQTAMAQYQAHDEVIKKFMKKNNCDRQNAIMFLQSNNYEIF